MFFLLFLEKPDQNSTEENIISQKLECTGTGINNIILIFLYRYSQFLGVF